MVSDLLCLLRGSHGSLSTTGTPVDLKSEDRRLDVLLFKDNKARWFRHHETVPSGSVDCVPFVRFENIILRSDERSE